MKKARCLVFGSNFFWLLFNGTRIKMDVIVSIEQLMISMAMRCKVKFRLAIEMQITNLQNSPTSFLYVTLELIHLLETIDEQKSHFRCMEALYFFYITNFLFSGACCCQNAERGKFSRTAERYQRNYL